jgi:hypothetical protein
MPSEAEVQRELVAQLIVENLTQPGFAHIHALGVGVPNTIAQAPEEIVVFHEPVADCEIQAAKNIIGNQSGGVNIVFGPAQRFVGLAGVAGQPAEAGGSIGVHAPARYNVPLDNASTLGAVITAGGKTYLLGCNHGLAFNGRALGEAVTFQGPLDEKAAYQIGRVAAYVPLNPAAWPAGTPSTPNPVDCALAEIAVSSVSAPTTVTPLSGSVNLRTSVRKKGRTTGYTTGLVRIKVLGGLVDLSFGTFHFDDYVAVVSTPPFAVPGDSGALVVVDPPTGGSLSGIGLVTARTFCSSGPYQGYVVAICRLDQALDALGQTIGVAGTQMTVTSL